MTRIALTIPSFTGAWRVDRLLESIERHDPAVRAQLCAIRVVHDPDPRDPGQHDRYAALRKAYPWIDVRHLPEWSNMHGAAQAAFEGLIADHAPDWIIYLGDDVLVTPGALSTLVAFLQHDRPSIALVQPAYWNAHELCGPGMGAERLHEPPLLMTKDDMYARDLDWLADVQRNPHWDGEGHARPYVNVNGVGFAARVSTFQSVGGFCRDTWCLDESLSVRVWLQSDQGIVCLPGPPLIHYFGAATLVGSPVDHDLYTEAAWIRGMTLTKAEAGRLSYAAMFARTPRIESEVAACGRREPVAR